MPHHDPDARRFTLDCDGETAYVSYHPDPNDPGVLVFSYILVPPSHRGRGTAGRLLKFAFDHARTHDLKVRPTCPYIAGTYVPRTPAVQDLIAKQQ